MHALPTPRTLPSGGDEHGVFPPHSIHHPAQSAHVGGGCVPRYHPAVGLLNACLAEWPFLLCLQNLACGEDSALKGDSAVGIFEEQKKPVQLTKH